MASFLLFDLKDITWIVIASIKQMITTISPQKKVKKRDI